MALMIRRDQESREAIGSRIAQVREHYGLVQKEFAARIRIHQSTLALFEKGRRDLKDIYIKMICDEYGCNPDWLLDGNGSMFRSEMDETFEKYAIEQKLSRIDADIVRMFLELDPAVKLRIIGDFTVFYSEKKTINILA
jgi:transcriptional regulator with XRE-family HTH domain